MSDASVELELNRRIAARVRALRTARGLSLEALAAHSGVSRSMISLIERGESSPTAVILQKLAAAYGVVLSSLFDPPADAPRTAPAAPRGPVARRADQPAWRDPESGYVRRNVSPPAAPQPTRIVDVEFPAGARLAFDNNGRDAETCQQLWILRGAMDITVGRTKHRLAEGDCLAMALDEPVMFHNPTRRTARYAVVISSPSLARR